MIGHLRASIISVVKRLRLNETKFVMDGTIYLIENKVNGHKYIGQTRQPLLQRLKMHVMESKTKSHRPLYNAFKKYGIGNFKVSILEKCSPELLDEREVFWIDFHNTFQDPQHYNCTPGGEGYNLTEEIKNKISEKMKDVPRGEQWEKSMSDSLKKKIARGEKWGFLDPSKRHGDGKHMMRKVKGIPVLNPSKNQKTFALSDKELFFDSATEAAEYFNGVNSAICNSIKYGWTAYGYKWKRLDDTPIHKQVYGVNRKTGEKTEVFPSIKAAAKHWGKRDGGLRSALQSPGERSFMDHYWYFVE